MTRWLCFLAAGASFTSPIPEAQAQSRSALARETAEYVLAKFGKEAAKEGGDALARRIEALVFRYGNDAATAVRKVGPGTFRYVEEAGEQGLPSIRLMARHGDEAVWVVADKNRMAIFAKYGDDAAAAMMRHKDIAEPLLQSDGSAAARAFRGISPQNGRRMAMMNDAGDWTKIGAKAQLLELVARYGDRAMDYVWKNRAVLVREIARQAFLANPEPFLDGSDDLQKVSDPPGFKNADSPDLFSREGIVIAAAAFGLIAGLCWIIRRGLLRKPR